jgi:DNA-binding transcriptional MerR regulator
MNESTSSSTPGGPRFQIGTVSTLTGLHPHTIRAWERRHAAVLPLRSEGGTRLYDEDDVARLQLMKALQDRGDSLARTARLPRDELEKRLRHLVDVPGHVPCGAPGPAPKVAVFDVGVGEQIRANAAGLGPLEHVGQESEPDRFLRLLLEQQPHFLVLGDEQLGDEPLEFLDACLEAAPGAMAVIVYLFAPGQRLEQLARTGSRLVRGPLSLSMLCRVLLELRTLRSASASPRPPYRPRAELRGGPPPRMFDDVQLGRLRETSTGVDCECPNHLASIVSSLVAFERYCRECDSRDATDAELHVRLGDGTAEARATMERLLARLCEHDGIRL